MRLQPEETRLAIGGKITAEGRHAISVVNESDVFSLASDGGSRAGKGNCIILDTHVINAMKGSCREVIFCNVLRDWYLMATGYL